MLIIGTKGMAVVKDIGRGLEIELPDAGVRQREQHPELHKPAPVSLADSRWPFFLFFPKFYQGDNDQQNYVGFKGTIL